MLAGGASAGSSVCRDQRPGIAGTFASGGGVERRLIGFLRKTVGGVHRSGCLDAMVCVV